MQLLAGLCNYGADCISVVARLEPQAKSGKPPTTERLSRIAPSGGASRLPVGSIRATRESARTARLTRVGLPRSRRSRLVDCYRSQVGPWSFGRGGFNLP